MLDKRGRNAARRSSLFARPFARKRDNEHAQSAQRALNVRDFTSSVLRVVTRVRACDENVKCTKKIVLAISMARARARFSDGNSFWTAMLGIVQTAQYLKEAEKTH